MLSMDEKEKFLNDVKLKASDKEVQESLRLEDNIDYRFDLVREDAFERGVNQGIEQGIEQTIISMFQKNISLETISDITGKSINEIKKITDSIEE